MELKKISQSLPLTIPTPYGILSITEPVLIELIAHPIMQRLKKIIQCGVSGYILWDDQLSHSRYDHSIGVFALVRMFGAPLKEQVAALLHDTSHTVFSHVGDFLFKQEAYQDSIHTWYLKQSDIEKILERHGYSIDEIANLEQFPRLEQHLPAICADRLDYTLYNALRLNKISQGELNSIIDHLHFEDNKWQVTDEKIAEKIGHLSLDLNETIYALPLNALLYKLTAQALSHALEIGLIKTEEIHFKTDEIILEKLRTSNNPRIKELLKQIFNPADYKLRIVSQEDAHHSFYPKFRGIDPLVKTESGFKRLTMINSDYAKKYEALKKNFTLGLHVKIDS